MNKKIIGMALAAVFASTTAQANPIMIDDFNGATMSRVTADPGPNMGSFGTGTKTNGTVNTYDRTATTSSTGASSVLTINDSPNVNILAHSQDSGVFGSSQIDYALAGVDLDGDGSIGSADAFRIALMFNDSEYTLTLLADGETSEQIIADTSTGTIDFLFSSFTGSVNWDNVTSVGLFIDGSALNALDVSLDNFETVCTTNCTSVPEPASIALLGLGIVGIGFGRRKLK